MSLPTTYLLNVGLHAGILSVLATLLLAFIRLPGRRSFAAISGLLVVGLLPWVTALRPSPTRLTPPDIPEVQVPPPAAELPLWTIVTVPMENEVAAPPAPRSESPAKWELPGFPATVITIWAAGAGIGLGLLALALIRVMLWKRSLKPLDDGTWDVLRNIIPSGPAKTDFLISPAATSPCVIGLMRSKIVIPHFLLDTLSSEKLRWALHHEAAHKQAGDSLWMILFEIVRRLKQVVITTVQHHTPWPEFPGINLSVIMSKRFQMLSISNVCLENGSSGVGLPSGGTAAIDVASGDPSIERRIFITVEIVE